jgi:hypothetical protein
MRSLGAIVAVLAGCRAGANQATLASLRRACGDAEYWDGAACKPRGDAAAQLAAGKAALVKQDVEQAKRALDAAEHGGPLDHDMNVTLWEQRGIAAAFLEDDKSASAAFDMLLALDPGHFLSYTLAPQVTFVFEKVRNAIRTTGAPAIDVNWPSGGKVGDPVPLDVQVVADPKQFLKTATVFVRARGEQGWRAADLTLSRDTHVVLPAVTAAQPTSLELYLRAYDAHGNEVLAWADPARPREIPLRYDPPPRWFRNWKVYAVSIPIALALTGGIVYAATREPPSEANGSATVK